MAAGDGTAAARSDGARVQGGAEPAVVPSPAADSSEPWVENCFPFSSLKCVCNTKLYFEKTSYKIGKLLTTAWQTAFTTGLLAGF